MKQKVMGVGAPIGYGETGPEDAQMWKLQVEMTERHTTYITDCMIRMPPRPV